MRRYLVVSVTTMNKQRKLRTKKRAVLIQQVIKYERSSVVVKLSENRGEISYGIVGVKKDQISRGDILVVRPVTRSKCPKKWKYALEENWVLEIVHEKEKASHSQEANSPSLQEA